MAQVHLLPVVHGLADGVAFAGNALGVLEGRQVFGEASGPATLEVDVLGVRDQERDVEVRQAQRDDEFPVADGPAHGMGDLNLVSDALLLDAMFRADEQDLACSVAECVLQQTLPVLPAAQSEYIRPDFVAGGGESRAEPDGEGVVLGVGVIDEDGVAGARSYGRSPATVGLQRCLHGPVFSAHGTPVNHRFAQSPAVERVVPWILGRDTRIQNSRSQEVACRSVRQCRLLRWPEYVDR